MTVAAYSPSGASLVRIFTRNGLAMSISRLHSYRKEIAPSPRSGTPQVMAAYVLAISRRSSSCFFSKRSQARVFVMSMTPLVSRSRRWPSDRNSLSGRAAWSTLITVFRW